MRASVIFGRVFGIPIGAHASWFLVFVLVTWSLAGGYFPQEYRGWSAGAYWLASLVTSALFFASVLVHELAHALVARREDVPVRGITLFVFGGVSQITREPPTAGAEFRIAVAGPLTSLALAALFAALGWLLAATPLLAAPGVYLARINLLLGVFNLLPGFPLDGGRVFRAAIWALGGSFRTATRWASNAGHALAFGFVLVGVSHMLGGQILDGLWIAFLGWFLNNAAEASYQQVVMADLLAGVTARDLMEEPVLCAPADLPIDQLVHDYILRSGGPSCFVGEDGVIEGLITLRSIKAVPRDQWHVTTTGEAMTPLSALPKVRAGEGVLAVLRRMEEAGTDQLPVVEAGYVVGAVTREHLLRFVRTRTELQV